jgi:hypothetical protein
MSALRKATQRAVSGAYAEKSRDITVSAEGVVCNSEAVYVA